MKIDSRKKCENRRFSAEGGWIFGSLFNTHFLEVISGLSFDEFLAIFNRYSFPVTIQPPPNQLDNIDFDVIGMSDY
jgi:hypothetical protein